MITLCSLIAVAAASRLRPLNVSAPAPPRRRVLDLFSYGGAHYDRILLVRLNELRDVVDLHVLVEMGVPLSLNRRYVRRNAIKQRWNASQRCWQGWADRILHVELDGDKLLTGVKKPAKAQQVMRTTGFSTALERALQRIGENAWVLLSDIDEVPRASALSNALLAAEVRRELGRGRTYALAGRSYYYNAECVSRPGSLEDHWIAGPKLLSSESLRSTSWQNLRTYFVQQAVEKRDELILWDASWHFGFLMTAQEQLTKLCLNVAVENHKICAHPKALSLVASASASCQDLWNRSIVPLVREERGTELPAFVREHYPDFARPRHSIHETENLCAHHDSGSGDSKLASAAIDDAQCAARDRTSAGMPRCPGCPRLCRCCDEWVRQQACVANHNESCNGCECNLGLRVRHPPGLMLGDALMLEVRPLPRIPMVLLNFRSSLPESTWRVNFWHGPTNDRPVLAHRELARFHARASLRMRRYAFANGAPVSTKLNYLEHDAFMKSIAFWGHESLDRPLLLLFEPDAALCPPAMWEVELEHFFAYAFVGAPWTARAPSFCADLEHCGHNSGLSLWRRDVVAAVLEARGPEEYQPLVADYYQRIGFARRGNATTRHHSRIGRLLLTKGKRRAGGTPRSKLSLIPPEMGQDLFFSQLLQAIDYFGHLPIAGVAPEALAATFSVETTYATNYTPIGVHRAYNHLPAPRLEELMRRCPPARSLAQAVAADSRGGKLRPDKRVTFGKRRHPGWVGENEVKGTQLG